MQYRIFKKRMIRNLNQTSKVCRGSLCNFTFKLLPIVTIILIVLILTYISFISVIIINNVNKISLEKKSAEMKNEITALEINILDKRQALNKDAVLAMGFEETTKIRYIETSKTVTTLLGNR